MQLGMIGLGRMGGNIVRRLMKHGHECVVFDQSQARIRELETEGAAGGADREDLIARLAPPRVVWVMLPAGEVTEATVMQLAEAMAPGDIVIDAGNSFYKDDIRRARILKAKGLHYVDVGTSGGVWGLECGYCMMIGGDKDAVDHLDPIFDALAPDRGEIPRTPHRGKGGDARAERGYIHAGGSGAGHFVKMIHNGIEYGLMQAYAEGFDILKNAASEELPEEQRYAFDLPDIAEVWRRGTSSPPGCSTLPQWRSRRIKISPRTRVLYRIPARAAGRSWRPSRKPCRPTFLSAALYARFRSRQEHTFAEKMLSAMRKGFDGHVEPPVGG